jgi:hypothetical protein
MVACARPANLMSTGMINLYATASLRRPIIQNFNESEADHPCIADDNRIQACNIHLTDGGLK